MIWFNKNRNKLVVGATLLAAAVAILNNINREEERVENKIREQKIILEATPSPSISPGHDPSQTPEILKYLEQKKEELITAENIAKELIGKLKENLSLHDITKKYANEDSLRNWILSMALKKRSYIYEGLDFSEKQLQALISKLDKTIKAYINRLDILHRTVQDQDSFTIAIGLDSSNTFDMLAAVKTGGFLSIDGIYDHDELMADYNILMKIVYNSTEYKKYQEELDEKYSRYDFRALNPISYDQAKEILYNCLLGLVNGLLNGARELLEEENKVLELNNKLLAFSEDLAKRYKSDIDKMTQLSEVITENIEILEKAITELGKFRERLLNEMKKYKYKKLF